MPEETDLKIIIGRRLEVLVIRNEMIDIALLKCIAERSVYFGTQIKFSTRQNRVIGVVRSIARWDEEPSNY